MSGVRKRVLGLLVLFLLMGAAAAVAIRLKTVAGTGSLATAPARRGEFLVMVRCRGELRARQNILVTAPRDVPELRIVWLAPPSSQVKEGDTVIRFDPSGGNQKLQEKDAALRQAQASLDQANGEARITAEQDKRDLAAARYEVEKARLEVSKQEVVSAVQAEQAKIQLGLADKKLAVQEATGALHDASGRAKIASLTRARDQAQAEVDLTRHRLTQMEVKAPVSGIIIYLPNYSQGWVNAKPFKVGDQVWPGMAVAEIPDLTTLEMEGKIEEIDRGRIAVGNDVRVRADSLPELAIPAVLGEISPLTQMTFEWPPVASFRGYAQLAKADPRLRPGMNATMDVVIQRLADAISVPSKALFTRNGKPIVYVAGKGQYRVSWVKVVARNPDEVAVEGIDQGAMVALTEPDAAHQL